MLSLRRLDNSSRALVVISIIVVVQAVELNLTAAAARVNELAFTDINRHVMNATLISRTKEQKITRFEFARFNGLTDS